MKKTVRFFKISDGYQKGWYADVPNHTLEENQMVAGADDFLEFVDNRLGGKGEVNIVMADNQGHDGEPFLVRLGLVNHNQWGATYALSGPAAARMHARGFRVWICNVTHDVFGKHPHTIYIYEIKPGQTAH